MPRLKAPSSIEWHFDIEGEGDTLIFIHGWGVDKRIWRQQEKYFSSRYRVMTVDLPGHGESGWQKVPLGRMADDLRFVLDENRVEEFIVVGSSVGGLLGLKLYGLYPRGIKKMSFCGSTPKFAKSGDYPFGLDVGAIRKLSGQLTTAYPSIVNIFFRSLFTREERESRRFKWLQKFRQTDRVPIKEALREYLDILEAEDLRDVLKKVNVPLQFINGTHDEICNMETVKYIQQLAPEARFDFFKQCGHFPFLSRPHEFNAVLEEFLKNG